ncbi:hypothetical protein BV898_03746 [Hypsibius exemplaris]|uniref:Solute carrier family 35 member F4 n=1 Tax=Hypsibius exemplaris TaxID=2072580 RepID=A0A1W0X435_HYPEX|nr:hypothetical protein BV898_03746 [Hypsibius exemplaris]
MSRQKEPASSTSDLVPKAEDRQDPATKTHEESTTILVVEEQPVAASIWKNWKLATFAVLVLTYSTLQLVGDQQIAKAVNSPTFAAPFFLLWYMGVIRTLTFPFYLLLRMTYDFVRSWNSEQKQISPNILSDLKIPTKKPASSMTIKEIYREAELIFGPAGLTVKAVVVKVTPFALLWVTTNGLFYLAVTFAEVSVCVAVSSSSLVFIHIISWTVLKEKFLLFKLLGVAVCMAGVILTVWASGTTIEATYDSLIAAALVLGSSLSLASQTVGFKRFLGSPTICQIALFQSIMPLINIALTWPIFLSLKLTGRELWDFQTAPFDLMSLTGFLGSTGALAYYLAVSIVSPVFISLSKPLQIIINNGIDIWIRRVSFGLFHGIGAGLVIVGFLMLLIPNPMVSFEIRAWIVRIRSGRKPSVEQVEMHRTVNSSTREPKIGR